MNKEKPEPFCSFCGDNRAVPGRIKCPACDGAGQKNGKKCPRCKGHGKTYMPVPCPKCADRDTHAPDDS